MSLLALLSADKVNLFSNSFLDLAEFIMKTMNRSVEDSEFAGFVVNYMISNMRSHYKEEPNHSLLAVFKSLLQDPVVFKDFKKTMGQNLMRQRRIFITPTLNLYQPLIEDETNAVLRAY